MPESEILSHIARIHLVVDDIRLQQLRSEAHQRYGASEEEDAIFPFEAEISNDLLDSHFTHMSESTLRNYAADAQVGVAFLRGHDRSQLPIGYSLSASYDETGGKKRVTAGFYTVRGLADTDDLIKRMQHGLVRDVSVGFNGGQMVCDICGSDFWDCRHYPGIKFEEKKGDTVTSRLSTFTIEDAHLSEVSGVFDGSTPDAGILKAQRAAKAGNLTLAQVDILEQRYRIKLPAKTTHAVALPKEMKMEEGELKRVATTLVRTKVLTQEAADALTEAELPTHVDALAQRLTTLEPQAEEGRQYRKDLVADALKEGVRAMGNDFDAASYEGTLNTAPLSLVKRMKSDWQKLADSQLSGGRKTTETEGREKKTRSATAPDAAFM